jgi:hypothetical protein
MAQAFAELEASDEIAALTHADWLGLLVDRELTHRRDKRLAARLRYARLRQQASERRGRRLPGPTRPRPRPVPQAHQWRVDRQGARQPGDIILSPGDIISESAGDIVGICTSSCGRCRISVPVC